MSIVQININYQWSKKGIIDELIKKIGGKKNERRNNKMPGKGFNKT